jgi:uroporphyrinogen decarboxylase
LITGKGIAVMNIKELMMDSIKHRTVNRIPTMYRADPPVNERLMRHFGLSDIEKNWELLLAKIGADNFSDGETLGAFTSYLPKYTGPRPDAVYEINHFFIWGIKPVEIDIAGTTDIVFHRDPPLAEKSRISDLKAYPFPRIEWFDFDNYKVITDAIFKEPEEQEEIASSEIRKSDRLFLNTYCINSIFMTSLFMRGIDNMMIDLVHNQKYAEMLIGSIGEFMLEFASRNLDSIGEEIDLYGIWDDFATQDDLMISRELWQKFYKPWHSRIIEAAKAKGLLVSYHICGNCSKVIPDLIEMGVDILDPVQVSARDMEISGLKKRFGKDICFHGGVDAQKMLTGGTPEEIRREVSRIRSVFGDEGGIILGPSHYITADTPVENILAIYEGS